MGFLDSIMSLLFGNKDQTKQMSTQNPEQQQALSQILSQLGLMGGEGGGYQNSQNYYNQFLQGNGQQGFENFAAPFKTQFNEQTLPGIAERFAGMGGGLGGGALTSSGFGQAIGGAGSQFQSNLSNLYAQIQQNAAGQLTNQYNQLSNTGLGARPFENTFQPGSSGLVGGLASGAGKGFGNILGTKAGMKWF